MDSTILTDAVYEGHYLKSWMNIKVKETFEDAQAGDTITILKDCSVSKMLEMTVDSITLKSENTMSRVLVLRRYIDTAKDFYDYIQPRKC